MLIIMILFPLVAMGQNHDYSSERPFWADGYYQEAENSYIEVVSAFDYDMESAKEKAFKEIVNRRNLATGAEVKVSVDGDNISVKSEHNLIIKARVIDQYVNRTGNGYWCCLLVQTAKNPTYAYENVTITDRYKFTAGAFVPGMAQIHKGSTVKGCGIIVAEALSVAGIILCENQRSSYNKKAVEQPKFAKQYSSKASNWETGRNVAIGAAACIYVYNIIDAIVAKGKPRIIMKSTDGGGLSFMPYISVETAGLSLAYRF